MSTRDADLIPLRETGSGGKQYYRYVCKSCGGDARNSFYEPTCTRMLNARQCFLCDYWSEFAKNAAPDAPAMTIIDGRVYKPGPRTSGSFRGMAGRRFDIEYVAPSKFAGLQITTYDLWAGGDIPESLRAQFPDTARFLGGAEKAKVGETTCWNGSERQGADYPNPSTVRGLK